jgi:hypothetical protein
MALEMDGFSATQRTFIVPAPFLDVETERVKGSWSDICRPNSSLVQAAHWVRRRTLAQNVVSKRKGTMGEYYVEMM